MTDLKHAFRFVLMFGLLWWAVGPAGAQTDVEPYAWEAGDLALFYPINWDAPYPFTDEAGQPSLQLAQVSAAEAQFRPPAAQTIRMTIVADADEGAFETQLQAALAAQDTPASEPATDAQIGGSIGIGLTGVSADGALTGVARIARVADGRVVMLVGRALTGTLETFAALFDTTALTIAPGAGSLDIAPGYAVQWQAVGADEFNFGPIVALAHGPNNQLYAIDAQHGLVILDAATGSVIETQDNDFLAGSVDIAVDAQGSYFLANPACRCLAAFAPNGARLWTLDNFAEDKPTQVINANGIIYADDHDERSAFARTVGASRQVVRPAAPVDRFWLATDRTNQPIALTPAGAVLTTQAGVLQAVTQFDGMPDIRAIDVDRDNNLVLASNDAGVFLLGPDGEVSERLAAIVASAPLPGEVVAPTALTVMADGTVIFADFDGDSGMLTAVNRRSLPIQAARMALTENIAMQGLMTETSTEHTWTFAGTAGDEITLSAVELSRAGVLDVGLRLLGPDGSEVAANDDQLGLDLYGVLDAQIAKLVLPQTGAYTAIVTRVEGSGVYGIGLTALRPLPEPVDDVIRTEGTLSDAIPAHYWLLDGRAGDILTITMQTADTALDPLLRLYGPDAELVAWNDDAADPDMGTTAQIVLVELPADGAYRLDATRFDGTGTYSLLVVKNQ